MEKTVAIVHFNTPDLTSALVRSVRRFTPGCRIVIFDNSDKLPFPAMTGVEVVDNTRGQVVDFEAMLAKYPNKLPTYYHHASAKHIASVDWLFDYLPDGFVLMDSDILLRRDITPLFDETVPWVGSIEAPPAWYSAKRLAPYLLWINVPMCRERGIRFMSEGRIYKLSYENWHPFYDTGASFYEDWKNAGVDGREIDIYDYIVHFGGASYTKTPENVIRWLLDYQRLHAPVLVVIPYCSEGAQGHELEHAVAGWRRHFKENYLIVIAGEDHPITNTGDDICCVPSERVPGIAGQYRPHLDYISCLRKVRARFPETDGFVMVGDDCYAVNDFDMTDVKLLKALPGPIPSGIWYPETWLFDMFKTRALLDSEGLPVRNFTTHLPQYFEWGKLEALWEKYGMDRQSYVVEDLYYNTYYGDRLPYEVDNVRLGLYDADHGEDEIRAALGCKIWINNSPEGWSPALEKILDEHYGEIHE